VTQRRTFDIPMPQTRRAWTNSFLVVGLQIAFIVVALCGFIPWWGALVGVLVVEFGFRAMRKTLARAAFDEAPTAPSKANEDTTARR